MPDVSESFVRGATGHVRSQMIHADRQPADAALRHDMICGMISARVVSVAPAVDMIMSNA